MFTDGKSVWREFGRVFGTVLLALVKIHVKKNKYQTDPTESQRGMVRPWLKNPTVRVSDPLEPELQMVVTVLVLRAKPGISSRASSAHNGWVSAPAPTPILLTFLIISKCSALSNSFSVSAEKIVWVFSSLFKKIIVYSYVYACVY